MFGVSFEVGKERVDIRGLSAYVTSIEIGGRLRERLVSPVYVKMFEGLHKEGDEIYHGKYASHRLRFPKFTHVGSADLIGNHVEYREVYGSKGSFLVCPRLPPKSARKATDGRLHEVPIDHLVEELTFITGKPIAVKTKKIQVVNGSNRTREIVHFHAVDSLNEMVVNGGPTPEELTRRIYTCWNLADDMYESTQLVSSFEK